MSAQCDALGRGCWMHLKSGAQGRGRFAIGGLRKSEMPVWQLVARRSGILPGTLWKRL